MKIATLNLRNDKDRWPERFDLVVEEILREIPDIIAFQEVALSIRQADIIADAVNRRLVERFYQPFVVKGWGPESTLGEAILSRYSITRYEETRLPEGGRVAQFVKVCEGKTQLNIINTHLHHLPKDKEEIRLPQIQFLLDWMSKMESKNSAWILLGDMNATPESETVQYILKKLNSAYLSVHGAEPELTFPTPLVVDTGDWYQPRAIDYIFFSPLALRVEEAHLAFTCSHPKDSTLFPSDHYGLAATLFWR
jgi:endonuclease/exonuclease/phosphatase family metal-dependent hydrolase